ncbi:prolipoprotein diacylglyceryl transferase [Salmonella enterica]|uniref:Prolipoprotein diacylglyceryl transferase n=1 Tax=Salmonella sp. NCTC 6947 TaxID=2583581 RepID=A0A509BIX6_9ENTR|nr:prolipoprotein diacylglyceryl transferase [Salmonella enterica]
MQVSWGSSWGTYWLCLFYNFPLFLDNPLYLFRVWDGGMSFHGGLIGVILVMIIFARRTKRSFFQVSDFIAPLIPFGLGRRASGQLYQR